jgi:hypothetical protein
MHFIILLHYSIGNILIKLYYFLNILYVIDKIEMIIDIKIVVGILSTSIYCSLVFIINIIKLGTDSVTTSIVSSSSLNY